MTGHVDIAEWRHLLPTPLDRPSTKIYRLSIITFSPYFARFVSSLRQLCLKAQAVDGVH
mgnify:CR=1 FL=1